MREDICQLSSAESEDLSDSDCCLSDWEDDYDDEHFADEPCDAYERSVSPRRRLSSSGSLGGSRRVRIDNILYEDVPSGSGGWAEETAAAAAVDLEADLGSDEQQHPPVLAWTTQLLLAEGRTNTAGIRSPPVVRLDSVPTPVVVASRAGRESPDRARWPRRRLSASGRRARESRGWDDPTTTEESGCSAASSSSGDSMFSSASSVRVDHLLNLPPQRAAGGGNSNYGSTMVEADSPGPRPSGFRRCCTCTTASGGGGGNYCGNYGRPGDCGPPPGLAGGKPNLRLNFRLGCPSVWGKDAASPTGGASGGVLRHGVRPLRLDRKLRSGPDCWGDASSSGRSSGSRADAITLSPHSSEGRTKVQAGLERCRRIFHAESPVAAFENGRNELGGGGWFGR